MSDRRKSVGKEKAKSPYQTEYQIKTLPQSPPRKPSLVQKTHKLKPAKTNTLYEDNIDSMNFELTGIQTKQLQNFHHIQNQNEDPSEEPTI